MTELTLTALTLVTTSDGTTAQVYLTTYASRIVIKALSAEAGMLVFLGEGGRQGTFVFDAQNFSAEVTSDPQEGIYLAPDSDATGASGAWVRVFTGAISVKWFGAVGDGATDDATAIQAAIDFAADTLEVSSPYSRVTQSCFTPPGNYFIASGSTLRLKKSVIFCGAGRSLSWFSHGGGGVPIFDTNSAASDNIEIEVSDLSIYGAGASTTYGLDANNMIRNCVFRNVDISNCNRNVRLENCWTFLFDHCNIRNAIVDNIEWNNATAGTIRECRIDSAGRNNILIGGSGFNTVNLSLVGSFIQYAQWYGLNIASAATVYIYGGYFEGNNAGNGSRSDILWSSFNDEGRVLSIFGSYFSSSNGSGATSRAIKTNGETLNLIGVRQYSGGAGYTYSVEASGNADVVNITGCSLTSSMSIGAGVALNQTGAADGGNTLENLAISGKFGFGAVTDLTISSGAITVSKSTHRVDTQAAASSDNLDTIHGGVDGMTLVLRTVDSGRDVIVKHNTGNIKLGVGGSVSLTSNIKSITLMYCADVGAGSWLELARA